MEGKFQCCFVHAYTEQRIENHVKIMDGTATVSKPDVSVGESRSLVNILRRQGIFSAKAQGCKSVELLKLNEVFYTWIAVWKFLGCGKTATAYAYSHMLYFFVL